ncbi:MAG: hypothetical protein ABIP33_03035 [Pseudolysinimonas sp.]
MNKIAGLVLSAVVLTTLSLAGCSSAAPSASSPTPSSKPVAAPAGRIVFRQFLDAVQTQGALFVINTDGTHKMQLTKPAAAENDGEPNWSADGTRIAYAKLTGVGTASESHEIDVINADGSGNVSLTTAGTPDDVNFNDQPAFSPDGTEIAYAHGGGNPSANQLVNTGIFIMDADGSNQHEVVTMPPSAADVGGVAWSPDGKQLLYGVSNTGSGKPTGGRAFFIVNVDGTGNTQLTKWDSGADGVPDWSAKTNAIAFRVAPNEESGIGNFFTVRPDGSSLSQVTRFKSAVMSHRVAFSPDGDWIVFGVNSTGTTHIELSKVDGSQARTIVGGDVDSSSPDWSPVP